MGRWSQYRHRGTVAPGATQVIALGPPPAPNIAVCLDGVSGDPREGATTNASDPTNVGGGFRLYVSTDGGMTYDLFGEVSNGDSPPQFTAGAIGDFVRMTEVGNETDYTGESDPSEALEITGGESTCP